MSVTLLHVIGIILKLQPPNNNLYLSHGNWRYKSALVLLTIKSNKRWHTVKSAPLGQQSWFGLGIVVNKQVERVDSNNLIQSHTLHAIANLLQHLHQDSVEYCPDKTALNTRGENIQSNSQQIKFAPKSFGFQACLTATTEPEKWTVTKLTVISKWIYKKVPKHPLKK